MDRDFPPKIGAFDILGKLGRGAQGTVYLAHQTEPVRRRVALKVFHPQEYDPQFVARFEAERQALAAMDHPNIAQFYEAGVTPAGQPYFVMEYAPGKSLTEYADHHRLSVKQRLELFLQVLAGVRHAHHRGVIHRDLKPSNILVKVQDDDASPKIIDFGVARGTDLARAENVVPTELGALVGTPNYMSPEQADPEVQDIDVRTDVYSLGAVLYKLLTNELPIEMPLRNAADVAEYLMRVREEDTELPSTRLKKRSVDVGDIAKTRGASAAGLMQQLKGELDWIVSKALSRDRTQRYEDVAALAADIRRYLDGDIVFARPPSFSYRTRKLVKRYRGVLIPAALVFVSLVVGLGVSVHYYRKEAVARGQEAEARTEAEQLSGQLTLKNRLREARGTLLRAAVLYERAGVAIDEVDTVEPESIRSWERDYERPLREVADQADAIRVSMTDTARQLSNEEQAEANRLLELLSANGDRLQQVQTGNDPLLQRFERVRERSSLEAEVAARTVDAWREVRRYVLREDVYDPSLEAKLDSLQGLQPIGYDPDTKLLEFLHVASSETGMLESGWETPRPLDFGPRAGMVFVLVPAGRGLALGCGLNTTASVDVPAFLMAKTEITQAQWRRLTGGKTPSTYTSGTPALRLRNGKMAAVITEAHPVETVSWESSQEILRRFNLRLPTTEEWEYAARAGGNLKYVFANSSTGLEGRANVADRTYGPLNPRYSDKFETFNDGYLVHAPVVPDEMEPNAFGLYHVIGNVREWTQLATNDPVTRRAAHRGGSFADFGVALEVCRYAFQPTKKSIDPKTGVRPAMSLP